MRIERLDPTAWSRLRGIRLRALDDEPDAFGASAPASHSMDEAAWRRLAGIGPWWLAVDDHDVGLVAAGHHDGDAIVRVYSMWVDPVSRGRGTADALLDAVRTFAEDVGASTLSLDVTDRVPRARRFYERYGFVATGATVPLERDPTITLVELVYVLGQDRGVGA